MSGLAVKTCVPCSGDVPPLSEAEIVPLLAQLDGWEVEDGHHLRKAFTFPDFAGALAFVSPNPSPANAAFSLDDLVASYDELAALRDAHAAATRD